jgi:hypothetical protein
MTSFSSSSQPASDSTPSFIVGVHIAQAREPFGVSRVGEAATVCQELPTPPDQLAATDSPLTQAVREQAIELAELLETKFELQGKPVQAAYAAHLRRQLEASRRGEQA